MRSEQALIQNIGRAARHVEGHVFMYADNITRSMQAAIDETNRRREIQQNYNKIHHIKPRSISRIVEDRLRTVEKEKKEDINLKKIPFEEYPSLLKELTSQMELQAANLNFEKAAELRDLVEEIKKKL